MVSIHDGAGIKRSIHVSYGVEAKVETHHTYGTTSSAVASPVERVGTCRQAISDDRHRGTVGSGLGRMNVRKRELEAVRVVVEAANEEAMLGRLHNCGHISSVCPRVHRP